MQGIVVDAILLSFENYAMSRHLSFFYYDAEYRVINRMELKYYTTVILYCNE